MRIKAFSIIALALTFQLAAIASSYALEVAVDLKTGDRLLGEILHMDEATMSFKSKGLGELVVDRQTVAAISPVEVELQSGERISGKIVGVDSAHYHVVTTGLGKVSFKKDNIETSSYVKYEATPQTNSQYTKVEGIKKPTWSGKASTGFNRSRGNVASTELNGGFVMSRKNRIEEFTVKGSGYYSERNRKMNSRKYGGSARTAFSFGHEYKWYHFYKAEVDHDQFGNVRFRAVPSAGLGYWFTDEAPFKFMVELAGGVQHTSFVDGSPAQTDLVAIPRLYSEVEVYKGIVLSEEVTLFPSIDDFGEYRYISETALNMPINKKMTLKFTVINEYDSEPGLDTKKKDVRILSSLAYGF